MASCMSIIIPSRNVDLRVCIKMSQIWHLILSHFLLPADTIETEMSILSERFLFRRLPACTYAWNTERMYSKCCLLYFFITHL